MTHTDLLQQIYDEALKKAAEPEFAADGLADDVKKNVEYIVLRSESNKAVLSVIITLLTSKILEPTQDIRYHYARMENGFSARNIDTKYVTPFMKRVSFPAMAESGWKTNTLAIDLPYDLNYPGVIQPQKVKNVFLELVDQFQTQGANPTDILLYIFVLLAKQRDNLRVELAKPHNLSIVAIIALLEKHFTANYKNTSGASRLPTLAIYAAYQCMMKEIARYKDKMLCPLEKHHSADARSGRIGDIDVNNDDDTAFEGVEIKHGIAITPSLITDSYEKFKIHNTDRYYLLTTANMESADWTAINEEVQRIAHIHGCQVIVNGVYDTLKYYLRLLDDTADFIDHYVECMKADTTIKFQHKTMWNDIVGGKI
ncbi:MAG: hypothetical protein FWH07_04555 [Oscillospiraceae bacterium]|nr:hypothetical protein [Oscillospiraceae bacterium]